MARAALDWNAQQLADAAGVGVATVNRFERSARATTADNVQAIRAALETAGVEFIPENGGGAGVRLKK
jgi:transcriptional regulator with XRE-family HTH domain